MKSNLHLYFKNHLEIVQQAKMAFFLNTFTCWYKVRVMTSVASLKCTARKLQMLGCLMQEYTQTVIVPICKNKNGDITDAGNCRPVSLATTISKLFEHYILSSILGHHRQPVSFQTTAWHWYEHISTQKDGVVLCKQGYRIPVFAAFLDASKDIWWN